ncbi:Uncharacterised protein [Kingella potus]|uniref:Fimb protein n=1 Tax=Kingella potus TaxID=265175 RepID=A0A377R0M8_9NEIS|nr:TfpX/TfpZ family type IV pilin accessory protein [Kingella potus]UOP00889.1 fimb protein [Kingella potus]STR00540.1 Uncharacterised protein [Kingella potus]
MSDSVKQSRWRYAAKLALIHLSINVAVALVVAVLIFGVWYPQPYPELMGGLKLLGLIVAVDMVCGPVLTSVLANPAKPKREMATDLSLVAVIQLAALIYGLHAVAQARPVFLAFEADRFTVVSAAEIDQDKLGEALPEFRSLPWWGVKRIGLRDAKDGNEKLSSLQMSLQGVEPSARPDWWTEETDAYRERIRSKMKPLSNLEKMYPDNADLSAAVEKSGLPPQDLYYLPFTSQKNKSWTVLMDKNTGFKAFVHLDAFGTK